MSETISNLSAPINITHEYIGFGNLFNIKWVPVDEAGAYVVQRLEGNNYTTVAIVLTNEFIDYEVAGFSYDDIVSYTYRIAALRTTEQTADNYSSGYPVFLNYVPDIIARGSEMIDKNNSDILEVNFNKEMKLLVQENDKTSLDFYKYSAIDNIKDTYLDPFFSFSIAAAPDKVQQIVDNNDDDYIFVKYENSNIVALSAENLNRKLTISDFLGTATGKIAVDFKNNLFSIIDSSSTTITVLKIVGNVTVHVGAPITIELGKEKNILDYNLINSKLFILDYFGRLHIYDIDKDLETITLFQTFFDDEDLISNYDSFYKRSFILKNIIDLCFSEYTADVFVDGFSPNEITNLKSFFLGVNSLNTTDLNTGLTNTTEDLLKKKLKEFSVFLNIAAYDDVDDYNILLNEAKSVIEQIFVLYKNDVNYLLDKPSLTKINNLIEYIKESEYLLFWAKRTASVFEKYISYEAKYIKETKIIHSELNNQIVLIGPYFYKILDLNIFKMQNYFHTFFSSGNIKNNSVTELISNSSFGLNSLDTNAEREQKNFLRALSSDRIDRFIDNYDTNKELESLSVCFEDIRYEVYFDETANSVLEKLNFSEKYLDLYKINFNSVFEPTDVDLTHSFFSGFGFETVFNYSNNIPIIAGSYYFYGGIGYKCLITKLRSARENYTIQELLIMELAEGFIEKIGSDFFNSLNLTTRIFYNSKQETFIQPRLFSLFPEICTVVPTGISDKFSFLNGKTIFSSKMVLAHSDIQVKSKIDNFNNTVLLISTGTEYDTAGKTIASLLVFNKFYIDNYFTLEKDFSLKRAKYTDGEFFSGDIKASDDPGVYFVGYMDGLGYSYISVFAFFAETFDTKSFKKIKVANKNVFFDLAYSYWTKFVRTVEVGDNKDFLISNDSVTQIDQFQEIYGNHPSVVWRWERNKEVVAEDDFTSFRVSIDKGKWSYLNKEIRSYSFGDELSDGTHKFYLQYQNAEGVWSDNIICTYYLKTIKPSVPVLSKIEKADGDNSKPVFYWTSEPDTSFFKVIYDNKIEYTTKNNYHSPDETFISYNKYANININVISYDKYGNQSEPANWLFTAKAKFDKSIIISYDRYTSNNKPYVTWKTVKDSSSVSSLHYRFDNGSWKTTSDTFFQSELELEDGAHFFELYYFDSLDNKSDLEIYYFEVNTSAANTPILTEETKQRTKKCSLGNLWFELNYEQSDFRMFYSFDNFKTEYEFFDYYLDLTNKIIKVGHKTIYFRFLDKFNNYSDTLEYSFKLQEHSSVAPSFLNVDQKTSNLRPTWSWTNSTESVYNILTLTKAGKVVFNDLKFFGNSFTPSFDLGDGIYSLSLNSVDSLNNFSDKEILDIEIDTKMPSKPTLKYKFNRNNFYTFQFEKTSNEETIYFKLIDLDNVGRFENNLFMSLNEAGGITLELKENTNFIILCKALGQNSVWSEDLRISFTTTASSFTTESFIITKDNVEYVCYYSNFDGSFKIEPTGPYLYDFNNTEFDTSKGITEGVMNFTLYKKIGGVLIDEN